ncbi:MAG: DUF4136 domain-containing protein [Pseudomonadota bacterium]
MIANSIHWGARCRTTFRLLAVASLGFLAACATTIKSDVARFHNIRPDSGETFAIVAADPDKVGSLEFEQYAQLMNIELTDIGLRRVDSPEAADLIVSMDYSVADARERVRSTGSFIGGFGTFGRFGGFNRFGGFGHGGGFGAGFNSRVDSVTIYDRVLVVEMDSAGEDGERVFEGRVESTGRNKRLPEVMPFLVEAMFRDFPGQSGVTQEIRVKENELSQLPPPKPFSRSRF